MIKGKSLWGNYYKNNSHVLTCLFGCHSSVAFVYVTSVHNWRAVHSRFNAVVECSLWVATYSNENVTNIMAIEILIRSSFHSPGDIINSKN